MIATTPVKDYLILLRPRQYAKNAFIFLPLFFALEIGRFDLLLQAAEAFAVFCLLASAVYIFNDWHDRGEDRLHPRKRNRPLAAGRIPVPRALALMVLLLASGFLAAWPLHPAVLHWAALYVILNGAYTLFLKHLPVVDIIAVAAGFVIRVFVGGSAVHVMISPWIVIMTFLLALFLALGKRRDDVMIGLENGTRPRRAIDGYNLPFVDASMVAVSAITIVAYIMYTLSPGVAAKFHTDKLYLTTLFVIAGFLRYLQIAMVENNSGSPTEILWNDRFIQFCVVLWFVCFGFLIY